MRDSAGKKKRSSGLDVLRFFFHRKSVNMMKLYETSSAARSIPLGLINNRANLPFESRNFVGSLL